MVASPQARQRLRRPRLTPTRIAAALAVIVLLLLVARLLVSSSVAAGAYLVLVLVTMFVLRGVRAEPGTWLSRRTVRRGLVIALAAVCVALAATPAPASGPDSGALVLFVVLILLNVALGRATQRVATAVDSAVDERQEALRNRAHRIAYVLLACVGVAAIVCDAASTQSRSWLGASLGGGGLIAAGELLFVLPAMVLAFLEPARIPLDGEVSARISTRARVGAWLLAATIAIPVVFSAAIVFLPEQLSASSVTGSDGRIAGGSVMNCRELFATRTVGVLVGADVPLRARVCWDGKSAYEDFGLNSSDCVFASGALTTVRTVSCQRVTSSEGTLSFTYAADVSPMLLPFLHRGVSVHLRIDRHGNVEQFP